METPNMVPQLFVAWNSNCMYGDSVGGGGGGTAIICTATMMMQKCFLPGFTSAG